MPCLAVEHTARNLQQLAIIDLVCRCCLQQAVLPSELFRESAFYFNPRFEQHMRGQPRGLAALMVRVAGQNVLGILI